jgi:uncharacterized protein YlxP (DUF503 family)
MKLWKSKKSAASSCVSAVSGKLNLSGSKNDYKDDDQIETISSAAVSSTTNQSSIHLANGNINQGIKTYFEISKVQTTCQRSLINFLKLVKEEKRHEEDTQNMRVAVRCQA